MQSNLARFTLPLLAKELTEQSAQWRTYALRTTYGLVLYSVGLGLFIRGIGGWDDQSFSLLGAGGRLFGAVTYYQLAAIYVLLPIITAGVITAEKERDTLGILLITKLGPTTIVLEKYLSRVLPMLMYMLMSLPLLAVAYSLGGVENGQVLQAGVMLTVCVLQVGALAVFLSAWCRTTAQAVVATYAWLGINFVLCSFTLQFQQPGPIVDLIIQIFAPYLITMSARDATDRARDLAMRGCVPVVLYLWLARRCLWSRAFLQARSWTLVILQFIDRFFHRINQNRFTRGVVLVQDHAALPTEQPVAWRETKKRAFGTTRYVIRFLLIIETPLIAMLLIPLSAITEWNHHRYVTGDVALNAVWLIAMFAVLTQSTALVAGERARQTLDVLLSTPLTMEAIVQQKMAGVRRFQRVLWIPLGTVLLFYGLWARFSGFPVQEATGWLALRTIALALIYLPLVSWLGFYSSLWCRTQTQALTLAAIIIAAAIVFPYALLRTLPLEMYLYASAPVDHAPWMSTWFGAPLVVLFPHGSLIDDFTSRPWGQSGYHLWNDDQIPIPLLEFAHWTVYTGLLWCFRINAPGALARSTQRCETSHRAAALQPA